MRTKICVYFEDGSSACFFDSYAPTLQGTVRAFEIFFPKAPASLLSSGPFAWLAFNSIVGLQSLSKLSTSPDSIAALSDFLAHVSTLTEEQFDLPALSSFWSNSLELHRSNSV